MEAYIVAEIGVNHDGNLEKAIELIDKAKICGCNAVKFQSFKADKLVDPSAKKVNYQLQINGLKSQVDLKNHNLNYKIREHSLKKIPLLLICGKKEVDSNTVTIRRLDSKEQENMEIKKLIEKFSSQAKSPS